MTNIRLFLLISANVNFISRIGAILLNEFRFSVGLSVRIFVKKMLLPYFLFCPVTFCGRSVFLLTYRKVLL